MSAVPERRTRPTIRCLRDDLGLALPTIDLDLGTLDHPLVDEARRIAPVAPQGQKRILAIDYPLVYRLRHGRWRGATWLEEGAGRFWLLAGAQRAAGAREDAYEVFVALHEAGRLLPTPTIASAMRSSATPESWPRLRLRPSTGSRRRQRRRAVT